jgi:hypothetical protein
MTEGADTAGMTKGADTAEMIKGMDAAEVSRVTMVVVFTRDYN